MKTKKNSVCYRGHREKQNSSQLARDDNVVQLFYNFIIFRVRQNYDKINLISLCILFILFYRQSSLTNQCKESKGKNTSAIFTLFTSIFSRTRYLDNR